MIFHIESGIVLKVLMKLPTIRASHLTRTSDRSSYSQIQSGTEEFNFNLGLAAFTTHDFVNVNNCHTKRGDALSLDSVALGRISYGVT